MFTGIITHLGRIEAISDGDGGRRLEIASGLDLSRLAIGASVAHSGVCLTVADKSAEHGVGSYAIYASPETLARTTMGNWQVGDRVNLETLASARRRARRPSRLRPCRRHRSDHCARRRR